MPAFSLFWFIAGLLASMFLVPMISRVIGARS